METLQRYFNISVFLIYSLLRHLSIITYFNHTCCILPFIRSACFPIQHLLVSKGRHCVVLLQLVASSSFSNRKMVTVTYSFFLFLRSVYKELHADHETEAADNKYRLSIKHRESARYSACFVVWSFQRVPLWHTTLRSKV